MQTETSERIDIGSCAPGATGGTLKIMMVGALPLDLGLVKGGVEAVILNLFAGFRNIPDVRIIHVAFTKETSEHREVRFADNITIHFLPFRINYELIDYFSNTKDLERLIAREKPDLIHIQEITPHIIRFLKYNKDNIVVTQHGIMREELKYASGLSQRLKCIFKAYVEKYVFPVFKHVIFISRYNEKLYPPKPVHGKQIYNPVNPIFFDNDASSGNDDNTMIYVGVLSRRKNIRTVIEALGELKKNNKTFKLHVVGGFKDPGYEDEIMALISQLNLKDQIIFHGWMKQEEIRNIYKSCPIFVLPSQQETLPVSIGEAMALGKIVIATDVGAINEMFTDKVSGFLFRKNDIQDLVRVLNQLYDTKERTLYATRARQEAEEKFHPQQIAEKTIGFYREVLANLKAKAV
jgi:glycosyltransferase involved in cell wall biosynthesis